MATIISFFLALFISILSLTRSDPTTAFPDGCSGRRIHIRRLPPRFNLDLLATCADYPLLDDLCPYLANHGLGQPTHNRSRSWFRTDPLMLELVFHRRVLELPCLTPDPDLADAIFLPYYAGLDALRYLYGRDVNSSAEHGLDLYRFLRANDPDIWERRSGHDHFLVMARPAWDFSQPLSNDPPIWGTSFLELPEFFNVTALTFEARAWPWQEQAIPYPTSFHPPDSTFLESWMARVRRSRRTVLMLFAGGGGGISATPNIRRSIRIECENGTEAPGSDSGYYTKTCDFVDCSNGICEHNPIRYMWPMLKAAFCLQPPGDTPTRRSTFDSLLAGCIPVFFENQSARSQYRWHLPEEEFEEFSVSLSKEEVVFKGLRIVDVLMRIPTQRVRKMREKVVEMIPRIMYRRHGGSPGLRSRMDAVDIAVEGSLKRIKARLQGVSA